MQEKNESCTCNNTRATHQGADNNYTQATMMGS